MILSGKARFAGVVGFPVGHSRSPRLHGWWLEQYGIDGTYLPLEVRPDDLSDCLHAMQRMGFAGCNITIPHKEAMIPLMDRVDHLAKRIGAVNTVIFREGEIHGTNTDAFGFIESLKVGAPAWQPEAGPVLILGAGGAARAVVVALIDAGVREIRIANRSRVRAESLAEEIPGPIRCFDWDQRDAAAANGMLLVNTTSLGMHGQPVLEQSLMQLSPHAVVMDIVYTPLETPLLADAKKHGLTAVDGLGMLLWQAVPGFEAWFGRRPEVTPELRDFILQDMV